MFVITFILGNVLVYGYDDKIANAIGLLVMALSAVMIAAIILLSDKANIVNDDIRSQIWEDEFNRRDDEF